MKRTRSFLVPFVLGAMGLSLTFLSGCRKEEPVVEKPLKPGVSTVAERMGDPVYVKQLDAQRDRQKELLQTRSQVLAKLQKMSQERAAAMKGADAAAVKASLEKDPEWQSLEQRVKDLNTAVEDNRQRTLAIVRGRMGTTKNPISK